MKIEQSNNLTLMKLAAMGALSTCLLHIERYRYYKQNREKTSVETERRTTFIYENKRGHCYPHGKRFYWNYPFNVLEILRFALHVEKDNVLEFFKKVSELAPFASELRRSWQRRGEDVKELAVPRGVWNLFAPNIPFPLYSPHTQWTSSMSSIEQCLQEILEHETGEKQWTSLFPTQESIVRISQILQSDKILKERVNQILANCISARKRLPLDKLLIYHVYNCLFSCHSSNSGESLCQKCRVSH